MGLKCCFSPRASSRAVVGGLLPRAEARVWERGFGVFSQAHERWRGATLVDVSKVS